MSIKKKVASVVIFAALSANASAKDNRAEECGVAVMKDYNEANLALLGKSNSLMTVEITIEQRRLQEQYCLRVARCRLMSMSLQESTTVLPALFSRCLREEAMEKYELMPADGK
ncbi:hypothetical protein IYX23_05255 [Methylocystis sp. L43]|uniref:hypothetical protein n=1 Tax=unclassified Methylocystis TaxID=2625913 RepID=UPI0018C22A47|nr:MULTISPECIES: hypothetical protein [unclassified Methylocystis]MBG0797093.1 hypothetical protein [Methylocystis sp. L43]MBG0805036.1 hypothetical protein [Methylocystis sp. H15]